MKKERLPRGLRNNNPLNIRISTDKFVGEIQPSGDKAFKQFDTMAHGYRAAFRVLRTYINNYKCDTIRKIISRWAPETENHTLAYVMTVSDRAGIAPDAILSADNREEMICIVAAMSYVENGIDADMSDVIAGWELL